jgi:hypothetical protein
MFQLKKMYTLSISLILVLSFTTKQLHAQSDSDLEQKMNKLYEAAEKEALNIPKQDNSGLYFTANWQKNSSVGALKTWNGYDVYECDANDNCTNTIIGRDTSIRDQSFKSVSSLGVEMRFNNLFSLRAFGSYANLTKEKGAQVLTSKGEYMTLKESFKVSYWGFKGSAIWYFEALYGGAGLSFGQVSNNLSTDFPKENFMNPHCFIGVKKVVNPFMVVGLEAGVDRQTYVNFQVSIPLSKKTRNSIEAFKKASRKYQNVYDQAETLDRQLHPEKFENSSSGFEGN